jgi:hypothetical protein
MTTYRGSCHCGRVAYEVDGEIDSGLACNCSMCQRKGSLLWFVPKAQFRLQGDESGSCVYTFNKHAIKHRFCPVCGIHPYADGQDAQGNPMAAINLRCIEGLDLAQVPVHEFDGRSR